VFIPFKLQILQGLSRYCWFRLLCGIRKG
jgi:hypothetical protein